MKKSRRGGARPGSGPKPKPAGELKRNPIVILLDDAELALVEKAAGGRRLNSFGREMLLRAARRARER